MDSHVQLKTLCYKNFRFKENLYITIQNSILQLPSFSGLKKTFILPLKTLFYNSHPVLHQFKAPKVDSGFPWTPAYNWKLYATRISGLKKTFILPLKTLFYNSHSVLHQFLVPEVEFPVFRGFPRTIENSMLQEFPV